MPRSPEVSSSFSGPFYNGCFILNISHLAERTTYARIQADHLNEVISLIDVYQRKMIETQPSKTREWLGVVASYLLANLVGFAIAWVIQCALLKLC